MGKQRKTDAGFGTKGWIVIIFTLFIYLVTSVVPDTLNVSVSVFADAYNWDSNKMLVFSAVGGFAGIATSLVFGLIVAKLGVKWPTVVLLALFAVTWLLYGYAGSFVMYGLAVTLATAVCNPLNLVSTQQIMNNWFPRKKGVALGWATIGCCVSSAVMVAVFQKMFHISVSAPFVLMAVAVIVLAVFAAVWFKSYPEEAGAYPDNEPISNAEREKNLEFLNNYKSKFTLGKLLLTKEIWMLALIFGFISLGLVACVSQMIPRLLSVGIDMNMAILWMTISSVIGIPASVIWGIIDQRIGTLKTVRIFAILWLLMTLSTAAGSAMESILVSSLAVVFYAVLVGGMMNLMPSAVIQVFGRYDFAQANKIIMPIVVGIRSCAFLVMPVMLATAGANINSGYRNIFLFCTVLSLVAVVLAFALKGNCIGKQTD